jgi:flagellar hook protein FlgE
MSFQQGLSGLNAAARNLDVIGNNVANSNTVGAKGARAEFATVYASSLAGASAATAGLGVNVAAVTQQFLQGELTTTNNPLDMGINGQGFFRLSNRGAIEYSRNGQFQINKDGFLQNSQGAKLTGFLPDAQGQIAIGVPGDLQLNMADISPTATAFTKVQVNLDARTPNATGTFNLADANTYSGATSMTIYDSLGKDHSLSLYFSKSGSNTWNVYTAVDGAEITPGPSGNLSFGTDGLLTGGGTINLTVPVGVDAGGNQAVALDLNKVSQYGSVFGVNELSQDGFATGRLAGFSVAPNGEILGRYSNGKTKSQGQVALANFINPQGLSPQSGNSWTETSTSGQPVIGEPGSGNLGLLQSGALEQSSVDMTAELVNMITAQRIYQANAQTIKTQDQVLQTLVNLR